MIKDIEVPETEDTETNIPEAEEASSQPGVIPEDFQKKFIALLDECKGSKECVDFMMDRLQEITGQPDNDEFNTEEMPSME